MAVYTSITILAPSFGPFLGGLTIDLAGWRWVYFVPLPFSIAAAVLATWFLPERLLREESTKFDWLGYALLVTCIPCFLIALTHGPDDGWRSDKIVTLLAISFTCFVSFIYWQIRNPHPLVNLRLFTYPRFASAACISFCFGAGMFAMMYLVPIFAQVVQGYTPTKAGLLQMPAGLIMLFVMPVVGRLVDHGKAPYLFIFGLSMTAFAGVLMTTADINTEFWVVAGWLMINRVGQGMLFSPLSTTSLSALPPHLVGQGPGMMSFSRSMGSVFGVNVMANFVEIKLQTYRTVLAGTQNAGNSVTQEFLDIARRALEQLGLSENIQEPASQWMLNQAILQQAQVLAFRDGFMLFAIVMMFTLIPAVILSRTSASAGDVAPVDIRRYRGV